MSDTDTKQREIAARFLAGITQCERTETIVDLAEFTLKDIDDARTHWRSAIAPYRNDYTFRLSDTLPLSLKVTWRHYDPQARQRHLRTDQTTSRLIRRIS